MNFFLSFDLVTLVKCATLDDAARLIQNAQGECKNSLIICRAIALELQRGNYCPTIETIKIKIPWRGK